MDVKYGSLFGSGGVSLDRLRALVEVDDAGYVAAAAPGERVRQGQLGRQIGELERFFEVPLKRKEGRNTKLTEEGSLLATLAREHLQSLMEFRDEARGQPVGVSLAAGGSLHLWVVLPRMAKLQEASNAELRKLRGAKAAVRWQLHTRKNHAMLQQLLDGRLDFGLLRSDLLEKFADVKRTVEKEDGRTVEFDDKPMVTGAPVGVLTYSVFVPEAVCPRQRMPSLEKILGTLPIGTQGDDTHFQATLEMAVAKRKWRLNTAFYGESFTQVAHLVASGTMAGILPDIAAASFDPEKVSRVPLDEFPELRREISLAWNPARHDRLSALEKLRPVLERVLRF